ncbi:hypothetical protein D3C76_1528690 [compost metagenome]
MHAAKRRAIGLVVFGQVASGCRLLGAGLGERAVEGAQQGAHLFEGFRCGTGQPGRHFVHDQFLGMGDLCGDGGGVGGHYGGLGGKTPMLWTPTRAGHIT